MHINYCLHVAYPVVVLLSVIEPEVIRRQMVMQQFTMLKMFLSALATSKHV